MLSRRIIRIKILQALYAHYKSDKTIEESEKELFFSIEKSVDLFFYLLRMVIDIRDYAQQRIDIAKQKKIPSWDDLNPNTRFVDNRLICQIAENQMLDKYLNHKKMSWVQYPELIKGIHQLLVDLPEFKQYMDADSNDYMADKDLVIKLMLPLIAYHQPVYQALEEQSVYWNSETEFVISMIIKVLKSFKELDGPEKYLIRTTLEPEDESFTKRLFRKTLSNDDKYKLIIDEHTKNWDVERIAFMDILVMQMAVNEIMEFPSIPKKVSFNEYIDIAKMFSTKNSGQFINGILDKIVIQFDKQNLIKKTGRGLIGGK